MSKKYLDPDGLFYLLFLFDTLFKKINTEISTNSTKISELESEINEIKQHAIFDSSYTNKEEV